MLQHCLCVSASHPSLPSPMLLSAAYSRARLCRNLLGRPACATVYSPSRPRGVSMHAQEATSSSFTFAPGCDLTQASCQGKCDKSTPLVTEQDLNWLLPLVPRWKLGPDGKALVRKFTARNFVAAVDYFQKVSVVAEGEGHHPDLHLTNYRDVEVVVSTHAAGGLTQFDFVLAAKLDTIAIDYSPKWLRENPEPKPEAPQQ